MEVNEFKQLYNSAIDSSTVTNFSLQSLKIDCFDVVTEISTLYDDFVEFFSENDFEVLDTPKDTVNANFVHLNLESDEDAYRYFFYLKYNLPVNNATLDLFKEDYPIELIQELSTFSRNLTEEELYFIFAYASNDLVDVGVLKRFSFSFSCTRALITLMTNKKSIDSILYKFGYNEKMLYPYLLDAQHKDSESTVSEEVASSDNSAESVEVCTAFSFAELADRDDYNQLQGVLENTTVKERDIIARYKASPYLVDIVTAYRNGIYCESFLDNYFVEGAQNIIKDRIFSDYSKGIVTVETLEQTKGNVFIAKTITDLGKLNLSVDEFLLVMQDKSKSDRLYPILVKLIGCYYKGVLKETDYFSYLIFLALDKNCEFLEKLLTVSENVLPFNKFCFSYLIKRLFNGQRDFNVPNEIGDCLLIYDETGVSYYNVLNILLSIDNLIEIIDSMLHGRSMQFVNLKGYGLGITYSGNQEPVKEFMIVNDYHQLHSLNSYLLEKGYESPTNFNAFYSVFAHNYVKLDDEATLDILNKLPCNGSYFMYDKLFYALSHELSCFKPIIKSNNMLVYCNILNRFMHGSNQSVIFLNFINRLFMSVFKEKYHLDKTNLAQLNPDSTIDVYGVSGYLNISINHFMENIDTILERLMKLDNVEIFISADRINIKGWS